MATIPDITIPSNDYVSLNSLSGVPVGTAMTVVLKSTNSINLYEGTTKPAATVRDGKPLLNMYTNYAEGFIETGSEEIWAICISGNTARVNVDVS